MYINEFKTARFKILLLLLIMTLLQSLLFAADKKPGTIRGIVTDKKSGEPLAGVNIVVKGTYYGASTDLDGFYTIPNIEPGEYTIEVSYVSYKIIRYTGAKVEPGKVLTLNFEMEPSILALGQEITVIGKKPLMDIEQTTTARTLNQDEIKDRIVDNVTDLVSQQVGVTKQDDAIYIRGSRSYESQYLVEGLSVQDPLSGTGFGLQVSSFAIKEIEVLTGGYKAEYGQATSGIISVKTKTGGDHYEGYFSYKTDNPGGQFGDESFSFNTDHLEISLSGPEPIMNKILKPLGIHLPGKIYFFFDFQNKIYDDYTKATAKQLHPSAAPTLGGLINRDFWAPRENNLWSGLFKFTWKINPTRKLTYLYNRSIAVNQNTQSLQTNLNYVEPKPGFPYKYSKILDNFNTFTHDNEQISLLWTHTLNKTTFYELRFNRYFAELRSEWGDNLWHGYTQPVDVPRLPVEYYTPYGDSTKIRVIPGDGFYDYGNALSWHDHFIYAYTLRGDLTTHIGKVHTVKTGIEAAFKDMQLIDIQEPFAGPFGSGQDLFHVYPADGSFYVQDDIRFGGFILNAGFRLDYWAPGKFADDAIKDTTNFISPDQRAKYKKDSYDIFGRRVKMRLMPRIGVSFPVSNNQMLYFNYGHFSKRPRPQFVYSGLSTVSARSAYQTYGNPALNPETSVKYELGLRNQFTENDVLSISAYYKDIFDYVKTVRFRLPGRGGQTAYTYVNLDYARSRGIEIEYKTRIGQYLFGDISGSYSITTTKSSNASSILEIDRSATGEDVPIRESYAAWDRPWQTSGNISFRVPANKHPKLFGLSLFNDWTVNLHFFAEAGRRYTPAVFSGQYRTDGRPIYYTKRDVEEKNIYSKIGSNWKWIDLSFKKYFKLWNVKYTFFIEVRNILNNKNAQIINSVTGKAYEYGDPVPISWNDPLYPDRQWPHEPYPFDPARYRAPRHVLMGISLEF